MKKVAIVAVLAFVVIGCVCVAGCTSQASKEVSAPVTVTVPTVEGTFYNVGNIAEIILPANGASTGYEWKITSKDDGLDINMDYEAPEDAMPGASGTERIWITSENPGTYKYTLKYMRSWDDESSAASVYNGTITFQDNADTAVFPDGASTSFVFDTFNINPKAGEYVKVVIPRGNATTGYIWTASGDGLKVMDDYVVDDHEEGMVGVPGTTVFYVTADKPGTYTLKAQYGRSWESSPIEGFEINLTFN